ncbi:hypothetical protein LTR97_003918 [Elasticomyces elasticus]|uniref:DUF7605 domain-containing protein n=1 Tax=Elasticomyces elasticus TaxID=574655 RepID=A0AAN7W8C3_9PEZI|nr:hypothetical protein LTR97_003918 [Elasticomyces elasticus]
MKAQKEVKKLNMWHWCSIKSFVNNNGSHETSVIGPVNWNEKFMEPAVKGVIKPNWRSLELISRGRFNELEANLNVMLYGIYEELAKKPDVAALPMGRFAEVIHGQIAGMRASLRTHSDTYFKDLANIKMYATQDRDQGYFTEAMSKCYSDCQEDGGPGYKSRVLTRFDQIVSLQGPASPFTILGERIAADVSKNAQKCALALLEDFDQTLNTIRKNFDAMIAQRDPDPTEEPIREELRIYMLAKQGSVQEIREKLEVIQNKDEYKK